MKKECKLFFAGDVVLSESKSVDNVFSPEVIEIIKKHDIACCNFEAPIEYENMKTISKIGPTLRQNREAPLILEDVGFNVIGTANNHIMDYGLDGVRETINEFRKATTVGVSPIPNTVYKPYIKSINGIKIAFLMVAENGFGCAVDEKAIGYAWMMADCIENIIKDTKKKVDIFIINCHAGAEYWEYPLPELKKLYKKWIEWGANVVIAHHPHIVQGWERYNDGLIFYSLGNFIFEPDIGKKQNKTIGVSLKINNELNVEPKIYYFDTYANRPIELSNDMEFIEYYKKLTDTLNTDEYVKFIDHKSQILYENMYKKYYNRIVGLYKGGIVGLIKSFIRRHIFFEKFSDLWLYHNIAIETHYWITRRALSLLLNKNKEEDEDGK